MALLENPVIRWLVAFAYLVVSLLLLIVLGDLPRVDQVVVAITVIFGFLIIPTTLKEFTEQQ
ncbi:hypothetical protein EKH57_16185 [Halorubrum sp. BOL3-1]|uniref:hypothetical protein n=1 Tax=Halorubrum sp. BOL3-1 TaxID=2497325 RepID=UPI001004F0DB|nr:hypothetical protein [Halorubrum sp. BOL3-1]QAU14107.1 hypothetical protein EKH57_16185 [Halorubrum sp. BOL3-1]